MKMKGSNKMFAMKVLLLRGVDLLLVCDTFLQVMEKEKIMKSQSQIKHANQEKMIMMGLEHPNIVRLWYAFQTPSKMYVPPLSLLLLVSPLYPHPPPGHARLFCTGNQPNFTHGMLRHVCRAGGEDA